MDRFPTTWEIDLEKESRSIIARVIHALDGLNALGRQGQVLIPQPLLATLPSGDVNAKVEREPDTNVPIVFFEQGLFKFLYGFSLLISWAVPPLSPQQLSDDSALALLARTYTIPVQASEFFGGILYEYVVSGTPTAAASSIGGRVENVFLSIALLTQMERFVMIHELSHLALGHLSESRRDSDWEYEFEADAAACDMVTDANHTEFGSWAVGFWACDLALTALHFLDRTLGLLAFGHANLRWISETHPPALNRRARLRERIGSIGPEPPSEGIPAAGELLGMSDAIFQRLWEISSPLFLISRSQQGVRPFPMWNERIKRSFEEKG